MTRRYLVTGAGPVGATVAAQLSERGDRVAVLTRSGSGPADLDVERLTGSAADRDTVRRAASRVDAVVHAIHGSQYDAATWERELPGAEQTVLGVAAELGVPVAFPESLYSYGAVPTSPERPLTETSPRRATTGKLGLRTRLLAAREASPAQTISVVASDFYGPRVRTAHAGERLVPKILAGKAVALMGSVDQPHSFTLMTDLARTMITALDRSAELGPDEVLHAPTAAPVTQRQLAQAVADAAGVPLPRIGTLPYPVLWTAGLFSADVRGLRETWYQFARPFVMDSSATEARLGLAPTALVDGVAATVAWWKSQG